MFEFFIMTMTIPCLPFFQVDLPGFCRRPFTSCELLSLVLNENQAQTFGSKFIMEGVELPTVTILMVGAYCDFMVHLYRNVEHVATFGSVWLHSHRGSMIREHSFRLIAAANQAKMLSLLQAVYNAMPSIQKLTLDGGTVRDSF